MNKSAIVTYSYFLAFLILISLLIILSTGRADADNMLRCFSCGERITGKYIDTKDAQFHKRCFICSQCGKQITGSYRIEGRNLYHPNCYKLSKGLVCSYCKKVLGDKWVEINEAKYHDSCYKKAIQTRCVICKKPITGSYKKDSDGSYHTQCYNNYKLEKCIVCSLPIEGPFVKDIWGNKSHNEHNGSEPDLCSSCGRIISQKSSNGGFILEDNRIICGICTKSSVTRMGQVKPLASIVKKKLALTGLLIPNTIQIQLVNNRQLATIAGDMHTEGTKGFTTSKTTKRGNKIISIQHTIYILHSLPKVEFMGVLAHEYLHVWLNERQIELTPKETEGFCNLGIFLINSAMSTPLSKKLIVNLEKNPDPVYGDGYRIMKKELDALGWKKLIEKISD